MTHITSSDMGQLCDGVPCALCNTCASCGRVLETTPHILVCACPDDAEHEVCDACLPLLDPAVDWSHDGDNSLAE